MNNSWNVVRSLLVFAVTWSVSACQASVGSNLAVPPDAAKICAAHCESIGMRLSAVAIMASNVGCVCQFQPGPPAPAAAVAQSATTMAGMSAILMQQAAAESSRRQASAR